MSVISLLLGGLTATEPARLRLARWRAQARRIVARSDDLPSLTDDDLLRCAAELRWRCQSGVSLCRLLPEAYALVREASRRAHGQSHYLVQVVGGIALFEGGVAEMQTGEGKTLTALLPAFLHALAGRGCHVLTANDYLASRDAAFATPIFARLGMTVGCVEPQVRPDDRGPAYAADITYGTAKEMGFDYLRDRLKRAGRVQGDETRQFTGIAAQRGGAPPVQRGLHFALVDEADSILIDEARTPLLIAIGEQNDAESLALFRWAARSVDALTPDLDYRFDRRTRNAELTEVGCRHVLQLPKPLAIDRIETERLFRQIEKALTARLGFARDKDYVVTDGEVGIVDESTGRVLDGRKWQDGLHQAMEAKEGVPVTQATRPAARITLQSFFNHYTHLAGLTGTAVQAARELRRTYRLRVSVIPTHRPCVRKGYPPRIFATRDAKRAAVAVEAERLRQAGRAVLIGTPSVEASEALGRELEARGIPHQILNCRVHKEEAEIISRAGERGKVTVATNMAGRGTDIKLTDDVLAAGGLHVIATELHSSLRIDRQLVGRTARQGEPGSYQFILSLEDELLQHLGPDTLQRLQRRARPDAAGRLPREWLRVFIRVQQRLERRHRRQRRQLLKLEADRSRAYRAMGLDPYLEMNE